MKKIVGIGMALIFGGVICGRVAGAESADDLLAKAASSWEKRADLADARQAVNEYSQALAADPKRAGTAWKAARACWWLGELAPKNDVLPILEKGKTLAEEAVKLEPDNADAHYFLGVCLGRIGEEQGILNSLFLVDPIAKEMEKVLSLDPKYGQAQHVLGVLYRKAPGWPLSRGDIKKALEYGRQAVANSPGFLRGYVGLAETLIALNQKEEAKKILQQVAALPGAADLQPESARDKEAAARMLKSLP